MKIFENFSLKAFHTFGVEAKADFFVEISKLEDLELLNTKINLKETPFLILGEGSNILFINDFKGIVLKINLKGKEILKKTDSEVFVKVFAGENWHEFVVWTLQKGFGGLENLSLIPGTLGAAPIQNIGAYGTELKDSLKWLEVYEISSGKKIKFYNKECLFGYRDSIFKRKKNKYIILTICFELKIKNHILNTSYGEINQELKTKKLIPTIQTISQAIINIREKKLPNPKIQGNAGSFFKNPIIEKIFYEKLNLQYKDLPGFLLEEEKIKIPAAWLIEKAGWKGKKIGKVGIHPRQALVLINLGGASGEEIYNFSKRLKKDIQEKFGIDLENEVTIF